MVTTTTDRSTADDALSTPSVLAVLVVRNGARWLRECLRSLAAQRYPRFGVVAVDNASTDGSRELLVQALGERRVLGLDEDRGLAGALRAAAELPAVKAADYLLILHDDVALAPDAVARLVEAAERIEGLEHVGVVGPKVVDWDDPRVLRDVGRSVDPFGHPYNPLQEGERDQGQYDRVLEVLFVSSCAMLVSSEAWERTGPFDERYGGHHDDLDFCWRARVAGFRVVMTPLAVVRHAEAATRGQRATEHRRRSPRYYAERAALASMLKDYGLLTLLWLLPLSVVVGLVRLALLALGRRFEDAYDLLAAWGWNVLHLPGTLRRRVRAQAVRRVRDRHVRRFMASWLQVPRWLERAEALLEERFEIGEEAEEEAPRLRERVTSFAAAHPVLVASAFALGLGAFAVRHLLGVDVLQGGALAAFPQRPDAFWHELTAGVRSTVLGGSQPASPALAALGGLSWAALGEPALAQKILLAALPPIAAVSMYRAMARQTRRPGPAVVAALAYGLSGITLWAFSEGRLATLVLLAVLPAAWDRLETLFARDPAERWGRIVVGLGVALAIGLVVDPGAVLPVLLVVVALLLGGRRRARGLALAGLGLLCGAALGLPIALEVVRAPEAALASYVGTTDPWRVLRFVPGGGPGTWVVAGFLPLAAISCFAIVGAEHRGRAWRALLLLLGGVGLGWASAARWLPPALTNQPAYLALAAVAAAALVGFGLATLGARLGREAFGARQVVAFVLSIVLALGFGGQALQVVLGGWDVGRDGLPPAWPLIDASAPGPFRIVWFGAPGGGRFPAPGGDPMGVLEAGEASIRYGITDRAGVSALDIGRARYGPGYGFLREALAEIVAGSTRHAGALLAPLGVRFLVAAEGDVPPAVLARLDEQVDLVRVPAGGLVIYRNPRALPVASVVPGEAFAAAAEQGDLAALVRLPALRPAPLEPRGASFAGRSEGGTAYLAQQFDPGWRVRAGGASSPVHPAFGWAIAAPVRAGTVDLSPPARSAERTVELWILAALWVAALWVTRKPARG
jgi:GT2 family glycosyltransferase